MAATLGRRAGSGARAVVIAGAVVEVCREIDAALSPIIGQRGMAALYKRSLYVISNTSPDLSALHEHVQASIDLDILGDAISRLDDAGALAGGMALLDAFQSLLTSLVGASLTERLLRPVWDIPALVPPSQDASQ